MALWAAERGGDGGERGVRLGAIGAAGLRHIRTSTAAFAAERGSTFFHQIDRGKPRGEIVGHPDNDPCFTFVADADDRDHAGTEALLAFIREAAQILEIDALHGARDELDIADDTYAIAFLGARAATERKLLFASASSRSSRLRSSSTCARRPGISSSGTLSSAAAAFASSPR